MRKLFLLFFLVFSFSAFGGNESSVNWVSYKEGLETSKNSPEKVMFIFNKNRFCAPCKRLERDVFTDKSIINFVNENFIPVKRVSMVPTMYTYENLKDQNGEAFKIKSYPALMFVNGDTHSVFYGYRSIEDLKAILKEHKG